MSLLSRWFGLRLEPGLAGRVEAWRQLPKEDLRAVLDTASLVAVDVETSGLNIRRDRLISIGAVEIVRGRLHVGRAFHGILRQERVSSRENVLLHGIGHAAQQQGESPADLLMMFLEYVGRRPLIAFHAPFDREFLHRACRDHLGVAFDNPFLDLAMLLPVLFSPASRQAKGLDDWSQAFGVDIANRHSADTDALGAAELFLVALATARLKGLQSFHALLDVTEDHARRVRGM